MNLIKLKINTFLIASVFMMNCPEMTIAGRLAIQVPLTNEAVSLKKNSTLNRQRFDSLTISQRSADSILGKVILHFSEQNLSSLNSYSNITHQSLRIVTNPEAVTGSISVTANNTDNHLNELLFSSETLSVQKSLKPGFIQSEILSTKSEGKNDSSYLALTNYLNKLSFSVTAVNLLNKFYLSPFSNAGFPNYAYTFSDSISTSGDSLYKMTYFPKPGKQFDGFSGTAIIDARSFALKQFHASSTQLKLQDPLIVIDQTFEQTSGKWLPSERNTVVFFAKQNSDSQYNNLIFESKIAYYQQLVNPPLSSADFNTKADLQDRGINPSTKKFIYQPIDQKNTLSQLIDDPANIAFNQEQQLKMIRLIAEGKISLGFFNFDYNKLFGYNLYDGIKLGLGGETNTRISKFFTVGGYMCYGFKNRSIQHGEWVNMYPSGNTDVRIYLGYRVMNIEFGGSEFLETQSLLNTESYRNLLIKNMFTTKRFSTGLEFRPFDALNLYFFGDFSKNGTRLSTPFLVAHPFAPFNETRTGLQLRYSPGIKFKMEDGHLQEINTPTTNIYFTIIQGLTVLGGENHYTKLEVKGKSDLPFSMIGTTSVMIRGGTTTQSSPITEFFNGNGSYAGTYSLAASYSFATMQLNEFAAANYVALHLRHNFSPRLFPEKTKTRPSFIFAQNVGFGRMNDQSLALLDLKDYRKGFYESGFEVNNLLRMGYLSWGVGVYYRYGPYQFGTIHDNFAYKFGFCFNL